MLPLEQNLCEFYTVQNAKRNTGQGMIERIDVQACHVAELFKTHGSELNMLPHGQARTVHLQEQARLCHGLILVPSGVGDGEQLGLVA
jgi:hypothetical protein